MFHGNERGVNIIPGNFEIPTRYCIGFEYASLLILLYIPFCGSSVAIE